METLVSYCFSGFLRKESYIRVTVRYVLIYRYSIEIVSLTIRFPFYIHKIKSTYYGLPRGLYTR